MCRRVRESARRSAALGAALLGIPRCPLAASRATSLMWYTAAAMRVRTTKLTMSPALCHSLRARSPFAALFCLARMLALPGRLPAREPCSDAGSDSVGEGERVVGDTGGPNRWADLGR